MAGNLCPHGDTKPHGEIGKDWCAGPPRGWMFEAFRPQLEEQMNLDADMFGRFADGGAEDIHDALGGEPVHKDVAYGLWQIHEKRVPTVEQTRWAVNPHSPLLSLLDAPRVIDVDHTEPGEEIVLTHRVRDDLGRMVPLGWFGWGEMHWYGDTPIYDALVRKHGFDPLGQVGSHRGGG